MNGKTRRKGLADPRLGCLRIVRELSQFLVLANIADQHHQVRCHQDERRSSDSDSGIGRTNQKQHE
jgi:hypothetical protein